MSNIIYLATRKSPLALWQAKTTQHLLSQQNINSELLTVVTTGDKIQHTQLSSIALDENNQPRHLSTGKGLFIKEIQEALLTKQAHLAVHSMKDLPVEQTSGLVIGALLPRADARDVLILSPELLEELNLENKILSSFSFDEMKFLLLKIPNFSSKPIGTTSARRQLLMKRLFSQNLNLQILRGNVDSRLKKVNNNEFSAILLAKAGLDRLNLFSPASMFPLSVEQFIPATAQGVIAIECAKENNELLDVLRKINCPNTCLQAGIERMVLHFLEGDCSSAVAAYYEKETIYVLYGKGDVEKEFSIFVTIEEIVEATRIFHTCQEVYSVFFAALLQSSFAQRVKEKLEYCLITHIHQVNTGVFTN
jgi:hydroxymethylbilane synthase